MDKIFLTFGTTSFGVVGAGDVALRTNCRLMCFPAEVCGQFVANIDRAYGKVNQSIFNLIAQRHLLAPKNQ